MDDESILQLFFQRREQALNETQAKYARLCLRVADGILADTRDAEECVNDTWLRAWNSIPPARPASLPAWLAKVTRNLAITRLRGITARKRGGGEIPLLLDELAECLPGGEDPQRAAEGAELTALIDAWLGGLAREDRVLFLRRYWYGDGVSALAKDQGWGESRVKTALHRLRKGLREHLEKEGWL